MTRSSRFGWGPLVIGLLLGAAGGLYYAWSINPISYDRVGPDLLSDSNQQEYILLVSHAYFTDFDLDKAKQRLAALGKGDLTSAVGAQADDAYQHGASPGDIRALTVLAEALGAHPLAAEVFSGTQAPTNPPAATLTATFEALITPTRTPLPTLDVTPTATFFLLGEDAEMKLTVLKPICSDNYAAGRLEVYVVDNAGGGIPGVEVHAEWAGHLDVAFTGLIPEVSPGYADFEMEANQTYTVTLPGLAEPVLGISSAECQTEESGQVQIPSVQLVFQPTE